MGGACVRYGWKENDAYMGGACVRYGWRENDAYVGRAGDILWEEHDLYLHCVNVSQVSK